MCCRVETLIVINAKNTRRRRGICASSGDLRGEEPRGHARHHNERRQSVEIRHRSADCESGDLGPGPLDRESDRRVTKNAEVIGVMGVLPDVLTVENEVPPERLLQASMKFIAKPRRDRIGGISRASEQRVQNIVGASNAGKYEVFVKGSFESSGIGDSKNRVGAFDVVSDAKARLRLVGGDQTIVQVAANAQIE